MNSLPSQLVKHNNPKVRLLEGYPPVLKIREYLAKAFSNPKLTKEHLDVWLAEPDLKSGIYSIDYLRQILGYGALAPHELSYKIIVFKDAHRLSELCMNALLKILEEPPAHLYFVLIAPSRALLIDTIVSRIEQIEPLCQGIEELKEMSPEKRLYAFIKGSRYEKWMECVEIAEQLGEEEISWENFFCLSWQLLYSQGISPSIQLSWIEELSEGQKIHVKERNLILALLIKIRSSLHDQSLKEQLYAAGATS